MIASKQTLISLSNSNRLDHNETENEISEQINKGTKGNSFGSNGDSNLERRPALISQWPNGAL